MSTQPVDVLAVLDAELTRAEASAVATASAAANSLRDAAGKAKQQQTANQARARADAMRETRTAVAELLEAARAAHVALFPFGNAAAAYARLGNALTRCRGAS